MTDRPTSPHFIRKSDETREQTLYDAYLTISAFRDQMEMLLIRSLTLTDHQRKMVIGHIRELSIWLADHRSKLIIKFNLTKKQQDETYPINSGSAND